MIAAEAPMKEQSDADLRAFHPRLDGKSKWLRRGRHGNGTWCLSLGPSAPSGPHVHPSRHPFQDRYSPPSKIIGAPASGNLTKAMAQMTSP